MSFNLSLFHSGYYPVDSLNEKIYTSTNKSLHTLVFDAGMGNWSVFFKPLAEKLHTDFNICLLDRPGYGRLSKIEGKSTPLSIARNMKRLLSNAGIEDSLILVGHSMGGLNVRMFQNLYPDMVKGIILIDAANPHLLNKMPKVQTNLRNQINQMKKIKWLARFGLLKFAKDRIPTFGLPEELLTEYYQIVTKPFYYETYIQELEVLSQSLEQCKRLPHLNDLPLLVISSKKGLNNAEDINTDFRWAELQKELASLSTNVLYLESDQDHFLHLSDLNFVAEAILQFYHSYFKR